MTRNFNDSTIVVYNNALLVIFTLQGAPKNIFDIFDCNFKKTKRPAFVGSVFTR